MHMTSAQEATITWASLRTLQAQPMREMSSLFEACRCLPHWMALTLGGLIFCVTSHLLFRRSTMDALYANANMQRRQCHRKQDLVSKEKAIKPRHWTCSWSGLVHLFDALDVLIKSETSKTKTHYATQNKAKQNKAKQNTSYKISRYIPTYQQQ